MALKPCRECGQPISTSAAACPHCGKKQINQTRARLTVIMIVIFFIIFIIVAVPIAVESGKQGATKKADDSSLLLPAPAKDGTYLLKTEVLACNTEGEVNKIADLFSSGDEEAGKQDIFQQMVSGECIMIDAGTSVFLKVHAFSDAYEIRARGSINYLWAPSKMVRKSLRG